MAYVYQIVLIIMLLCGSAFFSSAETTFSNITRRQIKQLKESTHKLSHLAYTLLKNQRELLNCFLLGNMTVNILYFATSSSLIIRANKHNPAGGVAIAITSFVMILLFGELVPKSMAYTNSKKLSIVFALPSYFCMKVYKPFEFFYKLIIQPFLRLLLGPKIHHKSITTLEFRAIIDSTRKKGLISSEENKLLTEVVELGKLKVRHVMRHRVDIIACDINDSKQSVLKKMQYNNLTKLLVFSENIDNIIGILHIRDLLLNEKAPLKNIIKHVNFVPEQKTVESLLDFFVKTKTDIAIVVDEYGGIAGSVILEDIAEELLGQIEPAGQEKPITQTGPFQYRLRGNLAIHDWLDIFDIDLDETQQATIGGLVTALLGKIPEEGDIVYIRNLKFTVEKIQKNRIEWILLYFEPFTNNDK